MPYIPPSGNNVTLDSSAPKNAPLGGDVNLEFSTVTAHIRQAGGFSSFGMGTPEVRAPLQYIRPQAMAPPQVPAPVVYKDTPRLHPTGIGPGSVGTPAVIWTQVVSPESIPDPISPRSVDRVRLLGGYSPPPAFNTILNWGTDPYTPPPGFNSILEFGALGYGYILGVTAGNSSGVGTPTVTQPLGIQPLGIAPGEVGVPTVQSSNRTIGLSGLGIAPGAFGLPGLSLNSIGAWPGGIAPGGVGSPVVSLKTRTLSPSGIPAGSVGVPIVGLNLKLISPASLVATSYGTPTFQHSRRTLQISGHLATSYGNFSVAQKTRYLQVPGLSATSYGKPWVKWQDDAKLINYSILLTM